MARLFDIVPLDHTWPRVHTIALAWIHVAHTHFISLLQGNTSSLRYLYLSNLMVLWRADRQSLRDQ
jgi:hypothetical protein